MNRNSFISIVVLLLLTIYASLVSADIQLADPKGIIGKWLLDSVSAGIDKPKIEEKRAWEFRADGILVTSGYNRHLKMDDTREFKYVVTEGKIKAEDPGRPGKTIDYTVYERSADGMILKGGIEGFYFFKKQ